MGNGVISKVEHSPLVSLCRERKELIKAARDCRYDLAAAHIRYFESLLNVGNALSQFVEEELEILGNLPLEDTHLEFSPVGSESELGTLTDYVCNDSQVLKSSEEDFHLKNSLVDSESELSSLSGCERGDLEVKDGLKPSTLNPHGEVKQKLNVQLVKSSSLMSSSVFEQPGALPMTMQGHDSLNFFHGDFQFGREKAFLDNDDSRYGLNNNSGPVNMPYDYIHYPLDGDAGFYNFPMDMYDDNCQTHSVLAAPPHCPPPMPEVSAWDVINPFNIIDDINFCYYTPDTYIKELHSSNYESIEVREKERISDLEEQNLLKEVSKEKILENYPKEGFGAGTPRAAASKTDEELEFYKEKGSNKILSKHMIDNFSCQNFRHHIS